MTKEELRKEFDELDKYSSNFTKILDNKFNWFWSKLEEKDEEIEGFLKSNIANKIYQLEAKLKAADEVITLFGLYGMSIDGRDITVDIEISKKLKKALEHYKSLKP
jgi:hypothetical protein